MNCDKEIINDVPMEDVCRTKIDVHEFQASLDPIILDSSHANDSWALIPYNGGYQPLHM